MTFMPSSFVVPASGRRRSLAVVLVSVTCAGVFCLSAARAEAMSFNVTFDSSVSGAPAGFLTAFNFEVQLLQGLFSDPIVINVNVGWGEVAGHALSPGNLGQSQTNQQQYTYAQVRAAMQTDAKSANDATAVASLPATNPTTFAMSNAEAKALGLLAGNATATDGFVGFNSSAPYTFDPNNRAVPGEWDFIGIAAHELTEVMGRYGWGQNGSGSRQSPIDLFRFSAPGVRNLQPTFGNKLAERRRFFRIAFQERLKIGGLIQDEAIVRVLLQ